ncbi:hypothetical protein [Nannocystis sp. SCPEA4]|uniref:hypothetical protein n=1 Tax=Nannocystis sp. SCPEA4 TaxID=2996787 RepID=UPI00226F416D|nr:hypothetical protein [Nannocystis sp. SCPEA4]MCY1058037.1 hypothetical protein [Nannocystis sp. SCPEA4]
MSDRSTLTALAWLAVCAALGLVAAARGTEAQVWGLIPAAHRPVIEIDLRVRLDDGAPDEALEAAVLALEPLPGRCPLAPPPAEARRWLDAHALSLLPREHHSALADRLAPEALRTAIAGARARLASPFAGLVGDDLRRDPLRLAELGPGRAGRLGFLAPAGPDVSARGDLVALDGRSALLCFHTADSGHELRDSAAALVGAHPVSLSVVGAPARDDAAAAALAAAPRVLTTLAAALILVLALAFRSVRPVVALLLAILGPAALLAALVAPLGLLDLPLLALAVGISAAPARPDWTVTALSALALTPLLLTPYPAWQTWGLAWAAALAAAGVARRVVQPVLTAWLGKPAAERTPFGRPEPPPLRLRVALPAAAACAVILSLGAWSSRHVRFDSPSPLPLADPELAAAEAAVRAEFFRPEDVALIHSPGATPEEALARAAEDLPALLAAMPAQIERVDAPGAFVVAEPELKARLDGLQALDIRGRLELLRATIAEFGMRPDAFGEFIRAAGDDLRDPPSPESALAGPLGPWLESKFGPEGVVTRAYLSSEPAALPAALDLRGPGVFARAEHDRFSSRAGAVAAAGAWLSALVVWLATRRLSLALALALAAIVAQCGLLALLHLLHRSFGPLTLPVFLLAGSAAAVAGLRAVRALADGRPWIDPGRLANALGPLAAALALLAAPEPVWRSLGIAAGLAVLAAHGVGGLVGPLLYALTSRAAQRFERRP